MNQLKKELAPLTAEAWEEIEDQARKSLTAWLSARRFLTVDPPKGWDFTGVPLGRLADIEEEKDGLCWAPRQFRPVVELRREFTLDSWEMDNVNRGAEDADLAPLEEAAESIARFEDRALYKGIEKLGHPGLVDTAELSLKLGKNPDWAKLVSKGTTMLRNSAIEPPFALVLNEKLFDELAAEVKGYPLKRYLEDLLGGPIVNSAELEGGLLVQHHSEDLRLTPGQDLSIGYQNHDAQTITLYFTETFVLNIYEPAAILRLS